MKKTLALVTGYATIAMSLFSIGCNKNNNDSPNYTVPTTYTFSNVDSMNAKIYLSMLAQLENTITSANTAGTVVTAAKLKAMFANTGNYFTDTTFLSGVKVSLNNSGTSLSAFTISGAQVVLNALFDSVGAASATGKTAGNGQAGVSDKKTLLTANGIYLRQNFTKLMMGALIGHMITDVYLTDSLNSSISIEAKQHAWDQAFYMWAVPVSFPANRAGVKYWGSYTSQIDSGIAKPVVNLTGINANPTLMNAFLKGRAALANNDLNTAKQQAGIIIPFFETMEAAAALHETNEAKGNLPNGAAAVCGNLSESLGFWMALKFNAHKKISDADYNAVLALYGTNFYNITPDGILAIQNKISSIYGWDKVKTNL